MESVLILGGNSDIAVAIAERFAKQNYNITLAGRNIEKLSPVQRDISIKHNVEVKTVLFDALDFNTHYGFVESLKKLPEITVCAFGYLGTQEEGQTNWEESQKIIHTNFTGAVSILNVIANAYEKRGSGVIVGISSVAGDRGRQSNYLYGSAKAAFSTYLSGLRNRLAKSKVHVLTVKPGFVATKMTEHLELPSLLTAKPENVAESVFKAIGKKRNEIYVLGTWRLIMLAIRNVPESIFKKLNL